MPALLKIDWYDSVISKVISNTRYWYRGIIEHESGGWSIHLGWIKNEPSIGEGILFVREAEKNIFMFGTELLLCDGPKPIARLTLLSDRYDNRLLK